MEAARQITILVHVACGTVALISMWIPLLSKKGGPRHIRGGWRFVVAMALTCASSFVASALRLIETPDKPEAPLFLGLVGLLAAVATLWGVRILRQKRRTAAHRGTLEWVAAGLLVAGGLAAIAYWARGAMPLFLIFGLLCVWTGAGFLRVLQSPPKSKMFWWYEHLGGMLVACISTVTAFLVVNYAHAPAFLREAVPGIAVWVMPGLVGGLTIAALTRHYRRKFET